MSKNILCYIMDIVRLRTFYEFPYLFCFYFLQWLHHWLYLGLVRWYFEYLIFLMNKIPIILKFNEKYKLCLCCLVTTKYGNRDILADLNISNHHTVRNVCTDGYWIRFLRQITVFLILWINHIIWFCFLMNSALIFRRINERSGPWITIPYIRLYTYLFPRYFTNG